MTSTSSLDIGADPVLETIVGETLALADAELVLLFGSRARGDFREDSDYDVLVVVAGGESPPRELRHSIRSALRDRGTSADVMTVSAAEYARQQHDPGFLAWLVSREGRVLFSTGRVAQRSPVPSRVAEHRPGDVTEGVAMWLERAGNDLRIMEQSPRRGVHYAESALRGFAISAPARAVVVHRARGRRSRARDPSGDFRLSTSHLTPKHA